MKWDETDLLCKDLHTVPQPEMGKILVTGATGYVGGRLVPELLVCSYSTSRQGIGSCNTWCKMVTSEHCRFKICQPNFSADCSRLRPHRFHYSPGRNRLQSASFYGT